MYELVQREFKAPNGVKRLFWYRKGTNDENTIRAAFEEDEYKVLDQKFEKNDTVIDLGAHIGAVTLLFTTIRPDLKIFAYEAMKENFELMRKNILANEIKNEMNIFNEVVWFYDEDKVKVFYGNSSKEGRIHKHIGSLFKIHAFYHDKLFKTMDATNLSKVFEDNRIFHCRFMKMDVEGAEYGILKGAPAEVLKMIDRIHGEYHPCGAEPLDKPREMLLKLSKGVFKDVTPGNPTSRVGPFMLVKK